MRGGFRIVHERAAGSDEVIWVYLKGTDLELFLLSASAGTPRFHSGRPVRSTLCMYDVLPCRHLDKVFLVVLMCVCEPRDMGKSCHEELHLSVIHLHPSRVSRGQASVDHRNPTALPRMTHTSPTPFIPNLLWTPRGQFVPCRQPITSSGEPPRPIQLSPRRELVRSQKT